MMGRRINEGPALVEQIRAEVGSLDSGANLMPITISPTAWGNVAASKAQVFSPLNPCAVILFPVAGSIQRGVAYGSADNKRRRRLYCLEVHEETPTLSGMSYLEVSQPAPGLLGW
jgi:hypothetical protein